LAVIVSLTGSAEVLPTACALWQSAQTADLTLCLARASLPWIEAVYSSSASLWQAWPHIAALVRRHCSCAGLALVGMSKLCVSWQPSQLALALLLSALLPRAWNDLR
jgi:hypothetical protein